MQLFVLIKAKANLPHVQLTLTEFRYPVLLQKTFKIIWFSILLTMSVPCKCYFWNESSAL